MVARSGFSDPDRSADPGALVSYLDAAGRGLVAAKQRLSAMGQVDAASRWLDLGCGAGSDLGHDDRAVGIDKSRMLLDEARRRRPAAFLVAGTASALPFATAAFDVCRIDRVLQHVDSASAVLHEAHRVVRAGGRVVAFEPDWGSMAFDTRDDRVSDAVVRAAVGRLAHGRVGRQLGRLLRETGFDEIGVQAETVAWTTLGSIRALFAFDLVLDSVRAEMGSTRVERWLSDLEEAETSGCLWMFLTRYFAVATRPAG